MTRDEKNARRRELDKDPFHHALSRKVANAWRIAHRDELLARRRAHYAANREEICGKNRAWREAHKDLCRKAWKKYADAHRARIRCRDRERYADPVKREHKKAVRRAYVKRPEVRNRINWQKRLYYAAGKHTEKFLRCKVKYLLEPRWIRLLDEPPANIERYRKRCAVMTWSLFVKWARLRGRYFDPQKTPDRKGANG